MQAIISDEEERPTAVASAHRYSQPSGASLDVNLRGGLLVPCRLSQRVVDRRAI